MPALDTNVLVRWLVDDDPRQSARVHKLLLSVQTDQDLLFIPATVMLEVEWVLRSRYQFDKPAILQAFNALLETQELEFQDEAALEWALHLYRHSTSEFADCLHVGQCRSAERIPLMTFDAKAARMPDVQLVDA